ncbi:uncharacterized protein [Procambarus clarkii]|uniref:uncharacterized protein n=1 Tax=Procambarus clarkii TaxID=6728 RepID=UPI003744937A
MCTMTPHLRAHTWTVLVMVVWWWMLPVVAGQLGLVAPGMLPPVGGPRASWWWAGGGASRSLITQLGERPPSPRRSPSTRESEIAAIFRGVAYGAPTHAPNTTITPTSTTVVSTTSSPVITTFPWSKHKISEERSDAPDGIVKLVWLEQSTATPGEGAADSEVSYIIHEESNVSESGAAPSPSPQVETRNTPPPSQAQETHSPPPQGGSSSSHPMGRLGENEAGWWGDMSGVRWKLGAAWWVHVYVSAGLLALLAAAAVCCMARSASTTLLPRPHYLATHALVFLAATLRSLHLFHDPYGVEHRLPQVVAAAVEEASWPCLTAALAVLAVVLAKAARRSPPSRPHATLVLTLMTALHLAVSISAHTAANLMVQYALPLRVVARAVTATWGAGVGVGGMWSVWRVEKSCGGQRGQLLARVTRWGGGSSRHSGLQRGTRVAVVANVAQIILATLHLYVLVAPLVPAAHVWAWWARVSLARGLELVVGIGIVVSAGLVSQGRPSTTRCDADIFSLLTSCGREAKSGRSANVFPATSEKKHIVGGFTQRPVHHPINHPLKPTPLDWTSPDQPDKPNDAPSITSDFQLLWNRERTQSATDFRPASMLVNDSGFVRFRTQVDPQQAMDDVFKRSSLNLRNGSLLTTPSVKTPHTFSSQTLPPTRYYCGPAPSLSSPERSPIRKPIRAHTTSGRRACQGLQYTHQVPHPTSQHLTMPGVSSNKYNVHTFDDYEVASYYHHRSDSISGSSNLYSTPHHVSPPHYLKLQQQQIPGIHRGRQVQQDAGVHHGRLVPQDAAHTSQPSDAMEPSTCSSLSEIHVDYLTDVSSSNDAVSLGSLPYPYQPSRRQNHHLLTLPLTPAHRSHLNPRNIHPTPTHCMPTRPATPEDSQQLDVTPDSAVVVDYTSAEEEERVVQTGESEVKVGGRAGLLSKLVGSSMGVTCYGYSPLDVDDTSSPSQETPSVAPPLPPSPTVRQAASSTHLHHTPRTSTLPRPPDTITSL